MHFSEIITFNPFNMAHKNSIVILRISIGIIFLWFGLLKFFPGLCPAEDLANKTINVLTFDLLPDRTDMVLLGIWECAIGISMVFGIFMNKVLVLLFVHMICTLSPMVLFPNLTFTQFPYAFTLEGQYIMKNLIILSAGMVIASSLKRSLN